MRGICEPVKRDDHVALHRAFDEARFGAARTLDLRSSMPTAADAVRRSELWLRQAQMMRAGEVLVITGRGLGSPGGVGVVREAIVTHLGKLRRRGVVATVGEHTPGSFVVTLAPVRALFESVRRSRVRLANPDPVDQQLFAALAPETRAALQQLAECTLDELGAPRSARFVKDEMQRQFTLLSGALQPGLADPDGRLRDLIAIAMDAMVAGD